LPIAQGDKNSDSTATSAISGAPNNSTGRIHARSEKPRTETDDHLGFAVAARSVMSTVMKSVNDKQYREVVEGGKASSATYTLGEHFSDRCLPEQADELCRQRYRRNSVAKTASARLPNSRSRAR